MAYNITKITSTSTTKKVLYFGAVIFCLLVIKSLASSTYDLWNKQDLVVNAKSDLEREKTENVKLKAQLSYVKSDAFIEEEARNKLFLVKPGESGVIVPKDLVTEKKEKEVKIIPNWQQWINLFVGE